MKAFQDYYPENVSHCYGGGSKNSHGHQITTFWDAGEALTWFTPEPYDTAIPGFAYRGLIASLIDCHSAGTSAAASRALQPKCDFESTGLDTYQCNLCLSGYFRIDGGCLIFNRRQ